MKYRINKASAGSFDVIVEDGGFASVYYNGYYFVTQYPILRLSDCDLSNHIYDEMDSKNSRSSYVDWDVNTTESEIINAALEYLVFPPPKEGWERDDSIWENAFND